MQLVLGSAPSGGFNFLALSLCLLPGLLPTLPCLLGRKKGHFLSQVLSPGLGNQTWSVHVMPFFMLTLLPKAVADGHVKGSE